MSAIPNEELLRITLSAAVPIWIQELRSLTPEERAERIEGSAELLASEGDSLLYSGGPPGKAAELFNRLAEGMAVLAFQPGGVSAFGLHFEADPLGPAQT